MAGAAGRASGSGRCRRRAVLQGVARPAAPGGEVPVWPRARGAPLLRLAAVAARGRRRSCQARLSSRSGAG
eukprot:12268730-Heterocapsa_arctica.AAC.1